MDKGIKLTEKEKAELVERVNLFIENHTIPSDMLTHIHSTVIVSRDIDELIDRINSLKYTDNLEDCTVRMIDYLLLLYNIYYNIYTEYMVGEYISAFRLFDTDIQNECIKIQFLIRKMIKKNIEGDIYKGSTSKWAKLLEELNVFYSNLDLNKISKEEITKKTEYIKENLKLQGCCELDIRYYDYNKIISLNAARFDKIQPVFKVIEYYYLLSGDENA